MVRLPPPAVRSMVGLAPAAVSLLTVLLFALLAGCQPTDDTPDEPAEPPEHTDSETAGEQPDETEPAPHAEAVPPDFADTVAEVRPAVVNIYTRTDPPDRPPTPFGAPGIVDDERVEESLGSGFIFDADEKLVLTNHHVVAEASEIAVRLLDERVFTAEIAGTDPPTDIAVLRLNDNDNNNSDDDDDDDLPAVELGDSDELKVGNWVLAIGNPLGLASTVTAGIASATGRQVMPPGGQLQFQDFIQTDASINPGSSGGPLVDTDGNVVGIATALAAEGHGLGFAIPMSMVYEVKNDLVEHGRVERSWLGIYIGEVPDSVRERFELPGPGGAMITRLVDDGPADRADLEPGDVIMELDNTHVHDPAELAWLAATLGVGTTVEATIYRGSEEKSVELTLDELPRQD